MVIVPVRFSVMIADLVRDLQGLPIDFAYRPTLNEIGRCAVAMRGISMVI